MTLSYLSASRETRSSNDDANVSEASNRHTCAGSVGMVSQRSQHFRQAFKDNKDRDALPDLEACAMERSSMLTAEDGVGRRIDKEKTAGNEAEM